MSPYWWAANNYATIFGTVFRIQSHGVAVVFSVNGLITRLIMEDNFTTLTTRRLVSVVTDGKQTEHRYGWLYFSSLNFRRWCP